MNRAGKCFAHYHRMQVSRREHGRQVLLRLIRQTMYVLQLIGGRKLLNLALFAAAADKAEGYLLAPYQSGGRFEQRIQRMTRAVVAGVHDHKFVRKTVDATKGLPSLLVEMNGLRPG